MKLSQILKDIEYTAENINLDSEINDVCYDSRKAAYGDMFVAIKGYQSDGHKYVKNAYANGVRVFAVEKVVDLPDDVTIIYTENSRKFLAEASANFFGNPAEKLTTIAITGTKGKTSVCYMLKSIFEEFGITVGIMGTTGIYYPNVAIKTENSTPESYEIHRHFDGMVKAGCKAVIIEATSQGFKLDRTAGINFDIGIYTNLSPDHIGGNEHSDFEEYKNCKKMLFSQCKKAIANSDSQYFEFMTEGASCPVKTYGITSTADLTATDADFSCNGKKLTTSFELKEQSGESHKVLLNIPGMFSIYNALAATLTARECGIDFETIKKSLAHTFVKGRMEIVPTKSNTTVIIDYAHNELSVNSLFDTVKLYKPSKITVVFGCGGNRSKLRRYAMGEIIGKNADMSVITSDNPRYERVEDIIEDILVGMNKSGGNYKIIPDRKEAIEYTVKNAVDGEIVLIVGKGHQLYEEIEGVQHPFNEREIVLACDC